MDAWHLPTCGIFGGQRYGIHGDFRDILRIIRCLKDPSEPEYIRAAVALALFYDRPIPPEHRREAMEFLMDFIACGEEPGQAPTEPPLLDWDKDAGVIVADINRVAGQEIRNLPFLHWWSFIAYFHGIGEGQLSQLVTIRKKLRQGKPLEKWEQEYYSSHKAQVDMKRPYTAGDLREQERLLRLLDQKNCRKEGT